MEYIHDPMNTCSFCGNKTIDLDECEWIFESLLVTRKMFICQECKNQIRAKSQHND
jgi:hypothetical protein